jgi:hypothetical protein
VDGRERLGYLLGFEHLTFAISRRGSSAVLPAPPGRRSCAQGRWSVARAPMTGWNEHDRGPQADAEERTRSAHRAIEIREKRRRVLSSCPAWITLAHVSGVGCLFEHARGEVGAAGEDARRLIRETVGGVCGLCRRVNGYQ